MTLKEKRLLLVHLLRDPQVLCLSLQKVSLNDFEVHERAFTMMWGTASDFYAEYSKCIPKEHLITRIAATSILRPLNEQEVDEVDELINFVYDCPQESIITNEGLKLLQAFLIERRVSKQIGNLEGKADIGSMLDTLTTQYRSAIVTDTQESNIFGERIIIEKESAGIRFVDRLLGGGCIRGGSYGLIGPTGAGKTALLLQMMVENIRRRKHVYYFTYEQGEKGLQSRIYSCISGIPSSRYSCVEEELNPSDMSPIFAFSRKFKQYYHFLDMVKHNDGGGANEIERYIEREIAKGIKPDFVIVDWILLLCMRRMNKEGGKAFKGELRHYVVDEVSRLTALAEKHDLVMFIAHQCEAASAGNKPKQIPKASDIAEAKNFPWLLSGNIIFGTRDPVTNVMWLVKTKARASDPDNITLVQLDTSCGRFRCVDGEYTPNTIAGKDGFVRLDDDGYQDDVRQTVPLLLGGMNL